MEICKKHNTVERVVEICPYCHADLLTKLNLLNYLVREQDKQLTEYKILLGLPIGGPAEIDSKGNFSVQHKKD